MIRYFPFPNVRTNGQVDELSLSRCLKWIQGTGNDGMLQIDMLKIHSEFEICENHFTENQFQCENKKKLSQTAVPTLFDVAPLSDENMQRFMQYLQADKFQQSLDSSEMNASMRFDQLINNPDDFEQPTSTNNLLDEYQKQFNNDMKQLKWYTCNTCKETFMSKKTSRKQCLHNNSCKHLSATNNMEHGEVPEELVDLTFLEEQLIARVHPIVSVYKVRGQQYAYSGNVINFNQSVNDFAKMLPHKISDLTSVITVKTQSKVCPKEFHVRGDKVKKALIWLKNNNQYYHDIEISQKNLDLLPEDENLFDSVTGISVSDEKNAESIGKSNNC